MVLSNALIEVRNGTLSDEEIQAYIDMIERLEKRRNRKIESIIFEVDGEYVNVTYKCTPLPFERLRRITGYLVGNTNRFNDGKRAELNDRVSHA